MNKLRLILICGMLLFSISFSNSQDYKIFNIATLDNPAPGYIFTGPINDSVITIYDNAGHVVYAKDFGSRDKQFSALRILENGYFSFYGVFSRCWFIVDKNWNMIDSVRVTPQYTTNFHTFHMSPQGHYLLLASYPRIVDMSRIVPQGMPNAEVADLIVQEFDENKQLVFEWDCYDHIDIRDATDDIDLTRRDIDPYHINQVVYDSDGNIIINFRNQDAIYKVNRSNGNVMWIWGGSKSKRNQFTFVNDTIDNFIGFSHQHDPKRLDNGNILLFDNGVLKPNGSSRAVEYSIDETNKTVRKVWEYYYPTHMLAEFMGNAQRLPNGNTMIGWGANYTTQCDLVNTEVTHDGNIAFESRISAIGFYQSLRYVYRMDAVNNTIQSTGNVSFNDSKNTTGINLNIYSLTGSGFTSVEKHGYVPYNLNYSSTKACTILPYRWVINNKGITGISAKITFDLNTLPDLKRKSDLKIFWRENENVGPFTQLTTTYSAGTNKLEADITKFGEFMLGYNTLYAPVLTYPRNDTIQVPTRTLLKWAKNSDQEKYHLQVSTNINFTNLIVDSSDLGDTQFELSNLSNYTFYYWRVKAYNDNCESNWSYPYTFVTIIGTPTLLSPLDFQKDQPLKGVLRWSAVKSADKYNLQISTDSTFKTTVLNKNIANYNFYNYSDLQYNTKYFWRVQAGSYGKYGNWSDTSSFSTYIGKVALKLPANNDIGIEVKGQLEWNLLPVAKSYRIQVCRDTLFDINIYDTDNIKTSTFNYSDLEKSTQYFWRVVATDNSANSEWSDIWRFWTIFPEPVLDLPENKSANNSIIGQLTWKPVPTASTYKVQLSSDADFVNVILTQETYNPTIKYTGLDFEKEYFWRVKAANGKLESDWSEVFSFTTQSKDLLVSPIITYPKNEEFKIPVNLDILWNDAFGAVSYDIMIATDPAFKNIIKTADDIIGNKYQATDLDYNLFYYLKIRAKNTKMTSTWSKAIRFTTWLKTPKVIYPLDADTNNVIKQIFKWESSPDAKFYHLQVAKDPEFDDLVIEKDNLEATEFDFTDLLEGVYYYWRVSAENNLNASDWTPTGKIKMLLNVGVQESLESIDSFNIYPIPVQSGSKVSLKIIKPQFVTIDVVNEIGVVVLSIITQQLDAGEYLYDLPSDGLTNGVYYCRLFTDKGSMMRKFQVVR